MYILMIAVAAFLFSMQFVFNNGFQRENGSGLAVSLRFSFYTSVWGFLVLLVINRFHLEFTVFSVLVAVVYGLVNIGFSFCSIKAFEYANLSVYSVFSMIGGMALPFAYGLLTGEELKTVRIVCFLLIILSVVMSVEKGERSRKALKYYLGVFCLNGLVGVLSEFHQSQQGMCVDSGSFMMLTMVTTTVLSGLLLLHGGGFRQNIKSHGFCAGYSVLCSVGNLLLLIALLHLPASVQYPIVTGGVIVFSTVIALARKDTVTRREIFAAGIAFAASVLMAL